MYGAFDVVLYFVIIQLFWLLINLLYLISYLILSYLILSYLILSYLILSYGSGLDVNVYMNYRPISRSECCIKDTGTLRFTRVAPLPRR